MVNAKNIILGIVITLIFSILVMAGIIRIENNFEKCIYSILKNENYEGQEEKFIEIDIKKHIFLKKITKKGYRLRGLENITSQQYRINVESKYPDFEVQIWTFSNLQFAKSSYNLIDSLITTSSYFEKPPKTILLKDNYCIYITTPIFLNKKYIISTRTILNERIKKCKK